MKLSLRPYQRDALNKLQEWLFEPTNDGLHPIVEASVGAGKSIMIAQLIQELIEHLPSIKVLMLVHVKELLEQNYHELKNVWSEAPAGVYSGGMKRYDASQQITYATIQSIKDNALKLGKVGLIVVDECHLINPEATGIYRKLIADLQRFNPYLRVIGFTGTPFRGNGVWLWEGDEALFKGGVCAKVTMKSLLDQSYLAPLVSQSVSETVSASDMKIDSKTGDYKLSDLSKLMDNQDFTDHAVSELVEKARSQDRKSWLVFCVDIKHAEHVGESLQALGITARVLTGKTTAKERERIVSDFKSGRITALVNVAVLTTGFNAPNTDLIALLRPTASPVLYVQIAGRGMRLANSKRDCLWLDFTDTTTKLGPVDAIKGRAKPKTKESSSEMPIKICPQCEAENHAGRRFCVECGEEIANEPIAKVKAVASEADILSKPVPPKKFLVKDWYIKNYTSKKGKDMLEVTFQLHALRPNSIRVWLDFEGADFVRTQANNWWLRQPDGSLQNLPKNNDDALIKFDFLQMPEHIMGKMNPENGYWNIIIN